MTPPLSRRVDRTLTAVLLIAILVSPLVAHAGCAVDQLRSLLDRQGRSVSDLETQLRNSPVTIEGRAGNGLNGARMGTLDDGTRVVSKPVISRGRDGTELRVGDYEMAASMVDRQLGLNSTPLIVERDVNGVRQTVQQFVEDASLGGGARWHPDELGFYDYLIRNQDRNSLNYLNLNGRPVGIDHGFSFTSQTLTSRGAPDFPRMVRDLIPRARNSAAAREQLQRLLPNQASFDRLVNTTPRQWRELLSGRLNEEEMAAFLQRRQEIIQAVNEARQRVGTSIVRNGDEPARFASQPGRFPEGAGPGDYVAPVPRNATEATAEITRSARISVDAPNRTLQPGRTYDVGILQRNGQMHIGGGLDEQLASRGTIRVTDSGAIEISGDATSRAAIERMIRETVPEGTQIRSVNRVSVAVRRVPERIAEARAPAVAAANQRRLTNTVSRLMNGNVRVRGGYRGGVVDEPPAPGNYIIVTTSKPRGGRIQVDTSLIQNDGDVSALATARRLRADNESYLPGHRDAIADVRIGPNGEVTVTTNSMTSEGDLEILNQRLRALGIRPQ